MSNTSKAQASGNTFFENDFREYLAQFPIDELETCLDIALNLFGEGVEAKVIRELIAWKSTKLGKALF